MGLDRTWLWIGGGFGCLLEHFRADFWTGFLDDIQDKRGGTGVEVGLDEGAEGAVIHVEFLGGFEICWTISREILVVFLQIPAFMSSESCLDHL